MTVLVISGGTSPERKISLISGRQVRDALVQNNNKVIFYDLKRGYKKLRRVAKKCDVIFPVIHGEEGEGGVLHKFLSKLNKPFVGGDFKAYKKGWYKIPFKRYCNKMGINTSPWNIVKNQQDVSEFGFPSVLKSSNGGSSREVVILRSSKDLKSSLFKKLMNSKDKLFIEKYLPGIELTVAIMGDKALPVLEIVPPQGKWFDYKYKYSGETQEIPNAPSLTNDQRKLVEQTALKIHQQLNMGDYSRIDFIFSDGKPYVLEINTIPGLTPTSLFPKAAKTAGYDFSKLTDKLISLAKQRFENEKNDSIQ